MEQKKRNPRIEYAVRTLASKTTVDNDLVEKLIDKLSSMDIDDAMDQIIMTLANMMNRRELTREILIENMEVLTSIYPEKYSTQEDFVNRLQELDSKNIRMAKMPLEDNHRLMMECFDCFNELTGGRLDCYYTGGMLAYLTTGKPFERYHGDLDLFINEEELEKLATIIEESKDFTIESNMDNKEEHGHEYAIRFRNSPMTIGLFLFSRKKCGDVVLKNYYYEDMKLDGQLFVDETELSLEQAELMFDEAIYTHNGIPYTRQSLEAIYNSKKNGRPKDKYDASLIRDMVDMDVDRRLDELDEQALRTTRKPVSSPIIDRMEARVRNDPKK